MTDIVLETSFQRARGVIGRYPDLGERYILSYDSIEERGVHMVGVWKPLKVTWMADGDIVQERVLKPWTGSDSAKANEIIEERPPLRWNNDSIGT